jgi:hypothetical protein
VLLGLVVELQGRPDHFFFLPLLWRVYEKQGSKSKAKHRSKPQLAGGMIRAPAGLSVDNRPIDVYYHH